MLQRVQIGVNVLLGWIMQYILYSSLHFLVQILKNPRGKLSRLSWSSNPAVLSTDMPQNKQNERMENTQGAIYTETRFSKSPQKQRMAKTGQSPGIASEESINYARLRFNRTSHHHRKWFIREKRKDPGSTAWRVATGVLGVLCMILMTTVGVLLPNLFPTREEEDRKTSPLPIVFSKPNECSCDLGSHSWIGFRNSYYHVSSEFKTWEESRAACSDLNAHLLKIDTKEERDVLSVFKMEGWIGVQRNEMDGSWLWEDGTHWKPSLFEFQEKNCQHCAYVDGKAFYTQDCKYGNTYICECNVSLHLSY